MLEDYKNIHNGERVFIIGNGPSLSETPLEMLQDEFTIALNKINLIYDDTSWRPTYYVFDDIADYSPADKSSPSFDFVNKNINQNITCFISEEGKKHFGKIRNVEYYPSNNRRQAVRDMRSTVIEENDIERIWSTDITDKIYNFGSTISVTAQIAHYMGFDRIIFVGCDLYEKYRPYMMFDEADDPKDLTFKENSILKKFIELITNSKFPIRSAINAFSFKIWTSLPPYVKKDTNHFASQYAPGQTDKINHEYQNELLTEIHQVIKLASREYGFEVYNATLGGHLDVYERVDFFEILDQGIQ